jgi:hypothetical protein
LAPVADAEQLFDIFAGSAADELVLKKWVSVYALFC